MKKYYALIPFIFILGGWTVKSDKAEIYTPASNATPALYSNSSGNVGIGTTTINDKLQVDGNVAINNNLKLKESGGSDQVSITVPSLTAPYTLTLPTTAGSNEQMLKTDGSGGLSWSAIADANVSASAGIDATKLGSGSVDNTELGYLNNVTSSVQTQLNGKLPLAGGTMTGSLVLAGDAVSSLEPVTKQQLDAGLNGIAWKQPVRAATTAEGTIASSFENGDSIDGVTLSTSDVILIKNQSTTSDNGIYIVNASGSPTRRSDADVYSELNGAAVIVKEGTDNANKGFYQITELTTFTGQSWIQNFGTGLYVADGSGIELSGGSTFSLELDAATLSKSPTGLKVADGGISNTQVNASAAIARSKLASGTASHVLINDGSGVMSSEAALAMTRGGSNRSLTAVNGGLVYSDADSFEITSAGATSSWVLSGGTGIPTMSDTTTTAKTIDLTANAIGLTVQGAAGQSSNLFVAENSAGTDFVTISSSGTIGFASEIRGNDGSASTPTYSFSNSSTTGIYSGASNQLGLSTNGSSRMVISSGGQVSITNATSTNLQVTESTTDTTPQINVTQESTGDAGFGLVISGATAWNIGVDNSDSDSFVIGDNGGGNIGSDTVFKLTTGGNASIGDAGGGSTHTLTGKTMFTTTSNAFEARTTNATATANIGEIGATADDDLTGTNYIYFFDSGGTTGNIRGASGTTIAFNTSSDGRLKKDVESFPNGLATVLAMKPRKYRWKEDDHEDRGFIAQELATVYPFAVSGDEEGDPKINPMSIDYGKLTPVLVAALQEQQKQIEALRVEISELKNKLAE